MPRNTRLAPPVTRIYPKDEDHTDPGISWAADFADNEPVPNGLNWDSTFEQNQPVPQGGTVDAKSKAGSSIVFPGAGTVQMVFNSTGNLSVEFRDLSIVGSKFQPSNCQIKPDILYTPPALPRRPVSGPSFTLRNVEVDDTAIEVDGVDTFLCKDTFAVLSACPDIGWNITCNNLRVQHSTIKYGLLAGQVFDKVNIYRSVAWQMEFSAAGGDFFNSFVMRDSDMCLSNLAWLDARNHLQVWAVTGTIEQTSMPNVYYLESPSGEVAQDYFNGKDDALSLGGWTFGNVQNCYLSGLRNDVFPGDMVALGDTGRSAYLWVWNLDAFGNKFHAGELDAEYLAITFFNVHVQVVAETDCIQLTVENLAVGQIQAQCTLNQKGARSPEDGALCSDCDSGHSQCSNHVTGYDYSFFLVGAGHFQPADGSDVVYGPAGKVRVRVHHNGVVSSELIYDPAWEVIVNGPPTDVPAREDTLNNFAMLNGLDSFVTRPPSDTCHISGSKG